MGGIGDSTFPKKILVVDDDEAVRRLYKFFFGGLGYLVIMAGSATEALYKIGHERPDIVLTDNSMPGMSGSEMVKYAKHYAPEVPIVMITGDEEIVQVKGVERVLHKPVDIHDVQKVVEEFIGKP